MKTITALATATAALATSIVAGAIFIAPSASTASFAPNQPGQLALQVRDNEHDGIPNVDVLVTDVNNPTAPPRPHPAERMATSK